MTERGKRHVTRQPERFAVGPSILDWDGEGLTIRIDEIGAPVPRRIRGTVRLRPGAVVQDEFAIDGRGHHAWRPIAPVSRIAVDLDVPGLSWEGDGYLDTNHGDEPLEATFASWNWARAPLGDGAAILYDIAERSGSDRSLALRVGRDGGVAPFEPPPRFGLPPTRWRMARETRCEAGGASHSITVLEDTPFYARSRVATRLMGEDCVMMHESLSLDRFARPWIQAMLPFRMPRRG